MKYTPKIQELLEQIFTEGYAQGYTDAVKDRLPIPDIKESKNVKTAQTIIEKLND